MNQNFLKIGHLFFPITLKFGGKPEELAIFKNQCHYTFLDLPPEHKSSLFKFVSQESLTCIKSNSNKYDQRRLTPENLWNPSLKIIMYHISDIFLKMFNTSQKPHENVSDYMSREKSEIGNTINQITKYLITTKNRVMKFISVENSNES